MVYSSYSPKDVARAGDTNSDGVFDDADMALLMDMVHGKTPKNATADCNGDGEINVQDMACVNNKRGQTGFDRVLFVYDVHGCTSVAGAGCTGATDEAGRLIGEYLKNGASFTTLKEYIWLGDLPVAVIEGGTVYHVYADAAQGSASVAGGRMPGATHLNTPRAITTTDGTLVWRWLSDAYGYVPPDQDVDGDGVLFTYNLRFPGQYFDVETGLFYNWHRNYDPMTGRYLEADPIGLDGGLNLYGYVGGNPLSYTDPLGMAMVFLGDGTTSTERTRSGLEAIAEAVDEFSASLRANAEKCGGGTAGEAMEILENWVIYYYPRLSSPSEWPGEEGDAAGITLYKAQRTSIYNRFWPPGGYVQRETSFSALPKSERLDTIAHEFRHLMIENDRLARPSDRVNQALGQPIPIETNAEEFARCICGRAP